MIIRNCLKPDAESEARVYNEAAARLPGFKPVSPSDICRAVSGPGREPTSRLIAEEDGKVVAYLSFESEGQVHLPWCLPGYEKMAHVLLSGALAALAEKKVARAYAMCRADWIDPIELLEDHEFVRVREMINFTQSIGDLPTMFQRPGLDVSLLRPDDIDGIESLAPGLLRLRGDALRNYLLRDAGFPTDAIYVLRKDGAVRGVGLLLDDAAFARVENLDPREPVFRFGAFGTEGIRTKRVNGMFSFLAAPGKDANLIGQDLLWYGTSRMETNTFDNLAAQAPSDLPHLCNFYERYFQKQGSFPVFEKELSRH